MVIRSVDHRHLDRLLGQQFGRFQAAKSGPDDDDVRLWRIHLFHNIISYVEKGKRAICSRKTGCQEAKVPLSSAPYAESDSAEQNSKIRLEAVQNYRDGQGPASTRLPQAPYVFEERQA